MATIDSRYSGRYRARIYIPGAGRLTKTFGSYAEAVSWAEVQEALVRQIAEAINTKIARSESARHPPEPPLSLEYELPNPEDLAYETPTLRAALALYARKVTPQKKGAVQERGLVRRWQQHPLSAFPLLAIRGKHLAKYRDERLEAGISGSTLQKDLALISHLYKVARTEWGYETLENPTTMIRKAKIARGRTRRFEGDEEAELLDHCILVDNLRLHSIIILAVETAMRRSELIRLRWCDINLKSRTAQLHDTKNGSPRTIPLSSRAVAAIQALPRRETSFMLDMHPDTVTYEFAQACKALGIEGLRFHDLRHEATSKLFEKGFNEMEVSTITGHKTPSMLKRYTHLKASDLLARLG